MIRHILQNCFWLRRVRTLNLLFILLPLYYGVICYRPQRSWGKVIFSEACVKNSVHSGGGGVPRPTPEGCWGDLVGGDRQVHTQGGILGGLTGGGVLVVQANTCRRLLLRAVCILQECILVVYAYEPQVHLIKLNHNKQMLLEG